MQRWTRQAGGQAGAHEAGMGQPRSRVRATHLGSAADGGRNGLGLLQVAQHNLQGRELESTTN